MRRRHLFLFLALVALLSGTVYTGAFTSVSADRTVSVDVAGDTEAYLGLEPSNSPDSAYARVKNGQLELVLDGSASGVTGQGLNPEAVTRLTDVFNITNRGTQQVGIQVVHNSSQVDFFANDRVPIDSSDEIVALEPGETTQVDLTVRTNDTAAVESLSQVTIRASAELAKEEDIPNGNNTTPTPPPEQPDEETLRYSGNVETGEMIAFDMYDLPSESTSNGEVIVDSLKINYTDGTTVNTTVSTEENITVNAPPDEVKPLRYVRVTHPQTSNKDIKEARVRFIIPDDGAKQTQAVDLIRYSPEDNQWETVSTDIRYVDTTDEGRVYVAEANKLSLLSIIRSTRGLITGIPASEQPAEENLIESDESTYPTKTYKVFRTKAFNESWWNANAEQNADEAAAVIRDELRLDLKETAKNKAIDGLIAAGEKVAHVSFSAALGAFEAFRAAVKSAEFIASFGPAVQQQAVAIHVDPGTESHENLRTKLNKLVQNTEAYKQADANGNVEEKRQLLEEREELLKETYQLLPSYLKDVHSSVIKNAAGVEDPDAYAHIRGDTEYLRQQLILDHRWTTQKLYGAPDTQLQRDVLMPTHGWAYRGKAEVFDTMDHTDDYVVLKVYPQEAVKADEEVTVTVNTPTPSGLDAVITSQRPDRPRIAPDRESVTHLYQENGKLTTQISDLDSAAYLVVRSSSHTGMIRATASSEATDVRLSIAERAGPDIQRPHANLVAGPDPVTLYDGDVVYPTNNTDTTLKWALWDDKTATENIEYRFRVDTGTGFTDWTSWQHPSADGIVSPDIDYKNGITRVQLHVRDGAGRTAVRNADVVVAGFAPQTVIAAPENPNSAEAYVRILPDRRIDHVDLEYKRADSTTWTEWKTVNDTRGFGRVTVPIEGRDITIRARGTGIDGKTGEWATETLTHDSPPSVRLADAPSTRPDEDRPHLTSSSTADLKWSASDGLTANDNLEYRVKTNRTSWTSWQSTDNGTINASVSVSREGTAATVEVRDASHNTASDTIHLLRDTTAPVVGVNASGNYLSGELSFSHSEPLRTVEVQYRASDESQWKEGPTVWPYDYVDNSYEYYEYLSVNEAGEFEVRVRGTDFAGNTGKWSDADQFVAHPGSTYDGYPQKEVSGGGSAAYDLPAGGSGGVAQYNSAVEEIDGELLLNFYLITRDGNIKLDSTVLKEERNQTVAIDLPPNLTAGDKLRVKAIGNGTVVLKSLRLIGPAPPTPTVSTNQSVANPNVPIEVLAEVEGFKKSYINQYEWDIDQDGEFERTTDNGKIVVQYGTPGTRTIDVRVTDIFEAKSTGNTTLRINSPPTARLAGNLTVYTGETATLSAAESTDSDGYISTYHWSIAGKDDVHGSNARIAKTFDDDGTYQVTLEVADNNSATDTAEKSITVKNRPPKAEISVGDTPPLTGEPIELDADGSTDPDGTVTTVEWDIDGDGTYERTGPSAKPSYSTSGNQTVQLQVTDDDGAINRTDITFYVNAPPHPNVSTEGPVYTQEQVEIDGTSTTDPDGRIVSYDWHIDGADPIQSDDPLITRTFEDDGTYPIDLTVEDDHGVTRTTHTNLTVRNRPPIAVGQVRTDTPLVGQSVRFDAAESHDKDGQINTVQWDVDGDGDFEQSGRTTTHTFEAYGYRTATVRVADDDGATNSTSVTFYVNAPPRPAINATDPVYTGEQITVDGTTSRDPDGSIVSYRWYNEHTETEHTGERIRLSFDDDGTYPIKLTVSDDNSTERTIQTNLTVRNRPPVVRATKETDIPVVGKPVSLVATDAYDPDGQIVATEWDIDNDGTFEKSGEGIEPTFNTYGHRNVTVRVTDNDGSTNATSVSFYVNAPPQPVIDSNDPVYTGNPIQLNGSKSVDPDGSIIPASYNWDIASDDSDTTGRVTNVTFQDDGTYPVVLSVTDNNGTTRSTKTNLSVLNRPPRGELTPMTAAPTVNNTVAIRMRGSDVDGSVQTGVVSITAPDGQARNFSTTTVNRMIEFTPNESGLWTINVTLRDDDNATASVNQTIRVNAPPKAGIEINDDLRVGQSATIEANATDPDGVISSYTWQVDGDTYTGKNITITPDEAGRMSISLHVEDDDGAVSTANRSVFVDQPIELELEAETTLGNNVIKAELNNRYQFSDNATIAWDNDGDGEYTATNTSAIDRVVKEAGEYSIGVRVTTAEGAVASTQTNVVVDQVNADVEIAWQQQTPAVSGQAAEQVDNLVTTEEYVIQISSSYESSESLITAYTKDTGTVAWTESISARLLELLTTDGDVIAVGDKVVRLDAASGNRMWTHENVSVAEAMSVQTSESYNRLLVSSYATGLKGIDLSTGKTAWQNTADPYRLIVATSGNVIYQTTDSGTDVYVARDIVSGERVWAHTPKNTDYPETIGLIDDTLLYYQNPHDATDTLAAIDVSNGTTQWRRSSVFDSSDWGYLSESTTVDGRAVLGFEEDDDTVQILMVSEEGEFEQRWNMEADALGLVATEETVYGTAYSWSNTTTEAFAIDSTNKSYRWSTTVDISDGEDPRLLGETVAISSGNPTVFIDRTTGDTVEKASLELYATAYDDGKFYYHGPRHLYAATIDDVAG